MFVLRYVLILVIMFCVYLIASRLASSIASPFTYAQKRKSEEDRKYTEKGLNINDLKRGMSKRLPVIDMREDEEIDLRRKLNRLGLDLSPKDIRQLQLLYSGLLVILAVLLGVLVSRVLFIIVVIFAVVAWKFPIMKINKMIEKRDRAVERELPKLYSVLYYTYKRTPNADLVQKIQSYIKNAGDLFYKEMMLFIEDSRNGDIYALRQFKKRVPISVVMRFCDIMENRLIGYDNTAIMYDFKAEMEQKMADREDKLLSDLDNKLTTISWVGVMVPIGMILTVYFGAQMVQTFRNF